MPFSALSQSEDKINKAAGFALGVELRMRIIAEKSAKVREEIAIIIAKNPKEYNDGKDYWDCKLKAIDQAILSVFSDLPPVQKAKLESFRKKRNKLLHADFIGLMKLMQIEPSGQEILKGGKRKALQPEKITEALLRIDNWYNQFRDEATQVIEILEELIRVCVGEKKT